MIIAGCIIVSVVAGLAAGKLLFIAGPVDQVYRSADDEAFNDLAVDDDTYAVNGWVHVAEVVNLETGATSLRVICDARSPVWRCTGMLAHAETQLIEQSV